MSPSYAPLQWPQRRMRQRYGLYRYLEQGIDTDSPPRGQPVIFVPGNAGSYQQVRSIASAASRQHQHQGGSTAVHSKSNHIDFYTVDFNEEFSAFHAQTLREQSKFLQLSIERVLAEYGHLPEHSKPTQVTFVSHSMGGIATLLALDSKWASMVDAVVTLSTPHMMPPVTIEYDMDAIYTTISRYSQLGIHPPIVSICGGISDTQIVSESCVLPNTPGSEDRRLTAFTSAIPMVWTGVDHQAIVWCHQVRWTVASLLLDWANANGVDGIDIARERLVGPRAAPLSLPDGNIITFPISSATSPTMTLLRRRTDALSLQECDEKGNCFPAEFRSDLLPLPRNTSAPFPSPGEGVNLDDAILSSDLNITVSKGTLEVRSVQGAKKDWVVFGRHVYRSVRGGSWEREENDENVTHYTLRFTSPLSDSLLTYDLEATIGQCEGQYPIIKHTSISVPSLQDTTSEARFYPITSISSVLRLHSHVPLGPFLSSERVRGVEIEVFQSPTCPIQMIRMSPWHMGVLGKIVTRYRMVAMAWPVGWASAVVLRQVASFHVTGTIPSYDEALTDVAVDWLPKSLVGIVLVGFLQTALSSYERSHTLILGNTDLAFIPLLFFFWVWSFGVTCLVWCCVLVTVSLYRKLLATLPLRWISSIERTRIKPSEGPEEPQRRPSTGRSNATVLGVIASIAIASFFVPHEAVHVAAFMILWTIFANEDCASPTIPDDISPTELHMDAQGLRISWSTLEPHESFFPMEFLKRASYDPPLPQVEQDDRILWSSKIAASPPSVSYDGIMDSQVERSEANILKLLNKVHDFGFCFVTNVPATAEDTKTLIENIAPIRHTHYGGFWSFTADLSHGDLAYSAQALPAHTDTTYFTDPAGLQIFHLLSHPAPGTGGTTLLVDGFYTASLLSAIHPESYDTLSRLATPAHASGTAGTMLRPPMSQPVFVHDEHQRLSQVRWNNEDRGVLGRGWTPEEVTGWYKAAREYEVLLKGEDAEYWVQLGPGTALVIDNWRVMHGRSEFTGARTMCGAYVGADDWHSRRNVLSERHRQQRKKESALDDVWSVGW
ncbi:trimethyllysine dioxygenase [Cryptococcus floricola]|uniref:GPI inositol-deacylase n=1 Tax=Cryptococcus floricola TaxID=2591691 RepID=A0A5D3AM42_9TREE|nr:trimethyllysine dioxygenase [Cryptococcus floricola]